jgi:Domain of unknown function (DUF4394)
MKQRIHGIPIFAIAISLLIIAGCSKDDHGMQPGKKVDLIFYGLTPSNELVKYNAKSPEIVIANKSITGMESGAKLLAIDFRPATGQLYAVGNDSRLYVINPETGAARALGSAPFTTPINGNIAGFDFNPTVDRIRLVTDAGQNLRLNPETGAIAAVDGNLNPGTPMVTGAAYTNSVAGAGTTTLFDIDIASQKLVRQNPPNNGTLVEVGSLGVMATGDAGFDISADSKVPLASLTVNNKNNLYFIDTASGKAHKLGTFGKAIIGLAIPTNPVAYSVDNTNNLLIFNFTAAGTPVSKPITGIQAGENILGIDMRPATGQLYALGSSNRIYTINMSSGLAAPIGTSAFTPVLEGESFGFDFNPTVDRIRIVSNTGQNLRAHPETGVIAFTDKILNPGTPAVTAAAYINNFAGSTMTTLFDIDVNTDKLYTQAPPNDGTLAEVGSLGINAESNTGFDIGGQSNKAYALLTVGSTAKIYSINTNTGAATAIAGFPASAKGLAIGLGF